MEKVGIAHFIFLHDDNLFLSSQINLKCLDLKTGTEKWVVNGSYSWFTSPFFYNNTLYIHNRRERKVLGFSIDDGKKLNSYTLYDKTYTVPIITDKYMYFGEAKEYKCMRLE